MPPCSDTPVNPRRSQRIRRRFPLSLTCALTPNHTQQAVSPSRLGTSATQRNKQRFLVSGTARVNLRQTVQLGTRKRLSRHSTAHLTAVPRRTPRRKQKEATASFLSLSLRKPRKLQESPQERSTRKRDTHTITREGPKMCRPFPCCCARSSPPPQLLDLRRHQLFRLCSASRRPHLSSFESGAYGPAALRCVSSFSHRSSARFPL